MSHKITFRVHGHGPTVFLFHGYGGSVLHWDPLVELLQDHYRVVVPNLSHVYMSTDKLLFGVQVEKISEFVFDHTPQNEKAHICGMSYGGAIAWGISILHPAIISSLSLINPMVPHPIKNFHRFDFRHYFRLPLPAQALSLVLTTPLGKNFLIEAAEIFREEKTSARLRDHELKGRKLLFIAQMISNFSWIIRQENWDYWSSKLADIQAKKMLIYDREDPLFNKNCYMQFSEIIRFHKFHELKGAGHLPIRARANTIFESLHLFFSETESKENVA